MTVIDSTSSPQPAGNPAVTVPPRWRRSATSSLTARGEPMVWLTGGCVAVAVLMIVLLLLFIAWQGMVTFWPRPIFQIKTASNQLVLGEPSRYNTFTETQSDGSVRTLSRTLYKVGNYDVSGQDFAWVRDLDVAQPQRLQPLQGGRARRGAGAKGWRGGKGEGHGRQKREKEGLMRAPSLSMMESRALPRRVGLASPTNGCPGPGLTRPLAGA